MLVFLVQEEMPVVVLLDTPEMILEVAGVAVATILLRLKSTRVVVL